MVLAQSTEKSRDGVIIDNNSIRGIQIIVIIGHLDHIIIIKATFFNNYCSRRFAPWRGEVIQEIETERVCFEIERIKLI